MRKKQAHPTRLRVAAEEDPAARSLVRIADAALGPSSDRPAAAGLGDFVLSPHLAGAPLTAMAGGSPRAFWGTGLFDRSVLFDSTDEMFDEIRPDAALAWSALVELGLAVVSAVVGVAGLRVERLTAAPEHEPPRQLPRLGLLCLLAGLEDEGAVLVAARTRTVAALRDELAAFVALVDADGASLRPLCVRARAPLGRWHRAHARTFALHLDAHPAHALVHRSPLERLGTQRDRVRAQLARWLRFSSGRSWIEPADPLCRAQLGALSPHAEEAVRWTPGAAEELEHDVFDTPLRQEVAELLYAATDVEAQCSSTRKRRRDGGPQEATILATDSDDDDGGEECIETSRTMDR